MKHKTTYYIYLWKHSIRDGLLVVNRDVIEFNRDGEKAMAYFNGLTVSADVPEIDLYREVRAGFDIVSREKIGMKELIKGA